MRLSGAPPPRRNLNGACPQPPSLIRAPASYIVQSRSSSAVDSHQDRWDYSLGYVYILFLWIFLHFLQIVSNIGLTAFFEIFWMVARCVVCEENKWSYSESASGRRPRANVIISDFYFFVFGADGCPEINFRTTVKICLLCSNYMAKSKYSPENLYFLLLEVNQIYIFWKSQNLSLRIF